jgi:hypothetical protein
MLRTISWDRGPQGAGARRRFPARRLHLVDIENLAGDSLPSLSQVRQALGLYADCLAFGAMDQVEVASSHLTLLNAALGWPHAHYRVRSGSRWRRPGPAGRAAARERRHAVHPCGDRVWRSPVRRGGSTPRRPGRLGDRGEPTAQPVFAARPGSPRGDLPRHRGRGCLMHASEAMAACANRQGGEPCGMRSSRFKIWRTVRGVLAGCR